MSRLSFFGTAWMLATIAACGGDEAKTCVDTLCDPAVAATCSGNDVRRCGSDGKRWVYESCGAQQRCSAESGPAACVPRQCTNVGVATCQTPTTVVKCLDDGSGVETTTCSAGEHCDDGVCVTTSCTGSDSICTAHGFLTCQNGNWTSGSCGSGQVCLRVNGGASCSAPICTPGGFRCEGESSRSCNALGSLETGTACGKNEICVAGRCQAEACGVDTGEGDATTGNDSDTGQPEAALSFKIGTTTTVLDESAFVEFDAGTKTLTLRAEKSQRQLRIIVENTRATVTGSFSDDVFSPTKVTVCWDDGGAQQTFDRCPDGFTHQSTLYDLTIDSNAGTGSRVTGTFESTVNDQNGDPTTLVDGTFSLTYR